MRELPRGGVIVDDSDGLLEWLGKDRAMVVFASLADFRARRAAFERIVRQWITHV